MCYIPGALGTKPQYQGRDRTNSKAAVPPCLAGHPLRRSREGISTCLLGKKGIANCLRVKGRISYKHKIGNNMAAKIHSSHHGT